MGLGKHLTWIISGVARILLEGRRGRLHWRNEGFIWCPGHVDTFSPATLINGVRDVTLEIFWNYICMHASFTTFSIHKSTPCKSKLINTLVSSRPLNAGCRFIETLQSENNYDYDIGLITVSSVYMNSGIHFSTPSVLEPGANALHTPLLGRCSGARRAGL